MFAVCEVFVIVDLGVYGDEWDVVFYFIAGYNLGVEIALCTKVW